MKTIGLLGGMSWESTLEYYRAINEGIKERLGGLHSAKVVMHSVDFGPVEELMRTADWDGVASILIEGSTSIERAGADFMLICTNTMHKLAPEISEKITIPLLHIADATAEVLRAHSIAKVGLLGTAFTMEEDFYRQRLQAEHGFEVLIPEKQDRQIVNTVIFKELCCGKIMQNSKEEYIRIIGQLADQGAEAIILGCTEIGLLVKQEDVSIPLFDTTPIHAAKAVEFSLADG